MHTLDLPVPRGLFRTPAATPQSSPARHASRQTTPQSSPEENGATPQASPTTHGLKNDAISYCTNSSTHATPSISPFRHSSNKATPNGMLFRYSPSQTTPNGSLFRYSPTETTPNGSLFRYPPIETTPNGSSCNHKPGESSPNGTSSLSTTIIYKALCTAEEYGSPQLVHQRTFINSPELGNEGYNSLVSCSTSCHRPVCQSRLNHAPEIHLNDFPLNGNTAHNRCASLMTEPITRSISQSYKSINDDNQSRQRNGSTDQSPSVSAPSAASSFSWCCFSSDSSRRPIVSPRSHHQEETVYKSNHNSAHSAAPPSESHQGKDRGLWEMSNTRPPQRGRTSSLQLLSREELQRIERTSRLVFYFRPQARSMSPSSERSSSDDDRRRSESVWCFRDINEFVISEADDHR